MFCSLVLPVTEALFSSDGNTVCYVFPVLRMTSFSNSAAKTLESKTARVFRPVRQVALSGTKSAVPDRMLLRTGFISF